MRGWPLTYCVCAGAFLGQRFAHADATDAVTAPTPVTEDRVIISADAMRLSGNHGGGGGFLDWLHSFNSDTVLGGGAEHDFIYNSHWTFGSLFGSLSGGGGTVRWNVYGEGHRGAGDVGTKAFDYGVEALGTALTFNGKLSFQVESRQFDIDPTHGNLPKATVAYLWGKQWLTTLAYAHSVGGNLDTELTFARLDHYGRTVNFLIGGATGHAAPAVVNLITGETGAPPQLREGFVGVSRTYPRVELALLGDYLDLSGSKRVTITLTCTLHARSGASK